MTKKNKSLNRLLDRLERREPAPSEYLHEETQLMFKLTCICARALNRNLGVQRD